MKHMLKNKTGLTKIKKKNQLGGRGNQTLIEREEKVTGWCRAEG